MLTPKIREAQKALEAARVKLATVDASQRPKFKRAYQRAVLKLIETAQTEAVIQCIGSHKRTLKGDI